MHAVTLFDTVPEDRLGFGRGAAFEPKRVNEWLDLRKGDVSRLAGVASASVRFDDHMPTAVRERLEEIATICNLAAEAFDGDSVKTALWFKTKNPLLGDVTPRDMVRLGRYDRLRRFIISARSAREPARSRPRVKAAGG